MSDATDFTAAFNNLKRMVQPDVAPVLTYGDGTTLDATKDLDAILVHNKQASTFVAAATYLNSQYVMPTIRNGHRYIVIEGGVATTEPASWPEDRDGEVVSGAVTFREAGEELSNIYNVRMAANEAWNLKVAKASQFIAAGDLNFHQVYEHCLQMADKFLSPNIA